ncbi:UNVERIFIED_CONTAM: hypothetical protein Sindi_2690500 [Sesamum indicum]
MNRSARLRILEPKAYSGVHDTKEVENFLFDMEKYFLAVDVQDETKKLSTATMYLTGDAKLWWRTKYTEIQAHQAGIAKAGAYRFRAGICESFLSADAEYPTHVEEGQVVHFHGRLETVGET